MVKHMKNIGYFKISKEELNNIDYYVDKLSDCKCDIIYYDVDGIEKFTKLINEHHLDEKLIYFDGERIHTYGISGILKIFNDVFKNQICGRPKGITEDRKEKIIKAKEMKDSGIRVVDIADHFGVKVVTVYNWLKDY